MTLDSVQESTSARVCIALPINPDLRPLRPFSGQLRSGFRFLLLGIYGSSDRISPKSGAAPLKMPIGQPLTVRQGTPGHHANATGTPLRDVHAATHGNSAFTGQFKKTPMYEAISSIGPKTSAFYSDPLTAQLCVKGIGVHRVGDLYEADVLAAVPVPKADLDKWFVSAQVGSPEETIVGNMPLALTEKEAWELAARHLLIGLQQASERPSP